MGTKVCRIITLVGVETKINSLTQLVNDMIELIKTNYVHHTALYNAFDWYRGYSTTRLRPSYSLGM